ncbi:MAG TPA: enolase C-terminal domain-like protein [Tepidisphaeraceae bacterium]|nr:enolase C-terminal domain-like protein [Tepidisphaeraceae bacterium]
MPHLTHLSALEILDSRGRPTVKATVRLASGAAASASVPSGASTGAAEAIELRDRDPHRYAGLGCRAAVAHVNGEIAQRLAGRPWPNQAAVDQTLIALDGTPDKSRLGANALLATSIAFARAHARDAGVELHEHFRAIAAHATSRAAPPSSFILHPSSFLPRLTINLFSGGKHAGGQVEFQDLLLVPLAPTIAEGLAQVDAVYRAAEKLIARKYNQRSLKADEGGLAPPFPSVLEMLADAKEAVEDAGFELGRDVSLAVDVASSHFYRDGLYHWETVPKSAGDMIDRLLPLIARYHIVSVEDALAEDDWQNWPALREALKGMGALTLGDDFLCTNPTRIRRAIDEQCADALLLKVNQIGTLTEAAEALHLARSANWRVTVSARSGETEDDWLADLAVGWSADQIKVGSVRQSERLAKYNRLLEIEAATNWPVVAWPG